MYKTNMCIAFVVYRLLLLHFHYAATATLLPVSLSYSFRVLSRIPFCSALWCDAVPCHAMLSHAKTKKPTGISISICRRRNQHHRKEWERHHHHHLTTEPKHLLWLVYWGIEMVVVFKASHMYRYNMLYYYVMYIIHKT